jgi:hypothetical protein
MEGVFGLPGAIFHLLFKQGGTGSQAADAAPGVKEADTDDHQRCAEQGCKPGRKG